VTFYVTSKAAGEMVDVISAGGEIDLHTAPELDRWIDEALQAGRRHVVVDMSEVTFIDSTAIGVLVRAHRGAVEARGSLRLVCTDKNVLRILAFAGLDEKLTIHETLDEALSALGLPAPPEGEPED
jgi:anti-sigma B factor antagonist